MELKQRDINIILHWVTELRSRIFNEEEKHLIANLMNNSENINKENILYQLRSDIKMRINNEKTFVEIIEDMGFTDVKFQMDDNHAWYFDAIDESTGQECEVQIEKDGKNYSWYRINGKEDWQGLDYVSY